MKNKIDPGIFSSTLYKECPGAAGLPSVPESMLDDLLSKPHEAPPAGTAGAESEKALQLPQQRAIYGSLLLVSSDRSEG